MICITKTIIIFASVVAAPIVVAQLSGSLSADAISKRLQATAQVNVSGDSTIASVKEQKILTPEQVYNSNCIDCHKAGIAGAPKLGDKAAWAPRIAQGKNILLQHSLHGLRGMPPKGNCLDCTEDEIRNTIDFMLSQ